MKLNLKPIVKESLREAFYTKKATLNEALFGHKLYVSVPAAVGGTTLKLKGVLTKNTKPYELEYRLTLFQNRHGEESPMIHYDMSEEDVKFILEKKELTHKIKRQISNRFFCQPSQIAIEFVDRFDEAKKPLFGIRMKVLWAGKYHDALISKNTIPKEKPFRFTWFSNTDEKKAVVPFEHHDMTQQDINYILKKHTFPTRMAKKFGTWGVPEIYSINGKRTYDRRVYRDLNETLFLMEESARELELFIDNKRPA